MAAGQKMEIEIKFRLNGPDDHASLRAALRSLGGQPTAPEDEVNVLLDDRAGTLGEAGNVLRLRLVDGGQAARLTFKGPASLREGVKSREEIETAVADGAALQRIFEALGFSAVLVYRKTRESWRVGAVEVTLDTLPFGWFCELEGTEEEIAALARRLGLDAARVETESYAALQKRYDAVLARVGKA